MSDESLFSSIDKSHPLRVLIVKTSSMGDIIQSFPILNYLHRRFPNISVDWALEESLAPIAAAHPLVRRTFLFDIKGMKSRWHLWGAWKRLFASIRALRGENYHIVFDLQGNCKSGVITLLTRAGIKVGFGLRSVREWPNILATQVRFEIPKQINIRLQHLLLMQHFFKDTSSPDIEGVRFRLEKEEREKLDAILSRHELAAPCKVMVCPGSKWLTKQPPVDTLASLLQKMQEMLDASFLLIWGSESERAYCEEVQQRNPDRSLLVERLSLPAWQNLMSEVDLVIAVDSSALHLCGTTSTPSFSIFGPTNPDIFKPTGRSHFAFQGKCPYGRTFDKTCPILRSCSTGACIRSLTAEEIFSSFSQWWKKERACFLRGQV